MSDRHLLELIERYLDKKDPSWKRMTELDIFETYEYPACLCGKRPKLEKCGTYGDGFSVSCCCGMVYVSVPFRKNPLDVRDELLASWSSLLKEKRACA